MGNLIRGPFTEPESEDDAYQRWRQEMDDKVSEDRLWQTGNGDWQVRCSTREEAEALLAAQAKLAALAVPAERDEIEPDHRASVTQRDVPKWITSWPDWFGIFGNVAVVPLEDYQRLEAELKRSDDALGVATKYGAEEVARAEQAEARLAECLELLQRCDDYLAEEGHAQNSYLRAAIWSALTYANTKLDAARRKE